MANECDCGLPSNSVLLRELRIIEYLDNSDGEIYKVDLSRDGTGEDLPLGDVLELTEWAKALAIAPMIVDLVYDLINDDGDEAEPIK